MMMVDAEVFHSPVDVFWTKDDMQTCLNLNSPTESDTDQFKFRKRQQQQHFPEMTYGKMSDSGNPDIHVPGVTDVGNKRPPKVKASGRKTREVKAKRPIKQPRVEQLSPPPQTGDTSSSCTSIEDSQGRQSCSGPSLKDLRPDDKLRVANLIKELAKVGEEKEKAVELLHEERLDFEKQILKLLQQQESILKERENIQTQLFTCQNLLSNYQHQILDKQEQLNNSIHERLTSELPDDGSEVGNHNNHSSSSSLGDDHHHLHDDIQKTRRKSGSRKTEGHSRKKSSPGQNRYDPRISKYDNVVYGAQVNSQMGTDQYQSEHQPTNYDWRSTHTKNNDRLIPTRDEHRSAKFGGMLASEHFGSKSAAAGSIADVESDHVRKPAYHRESQVNVESEMERGEGGGRGGGLVHRLAEDINELRTPPKSQCPDRFQNRCGRHGYEPLPEPTYHRESRVNVESEKERGAGLMHRLVEDTDELKIPPKSKCPPDRFQNQHGRRGYGPLPEPVMSSTQKSSEIIADMSLGLRSDQELSFHPLRIDSTRRTTKDSAGLPFEIYIDKGRSSDPSPDPDRRPIGTDDLVRRNRVGFAEHDNEPVTFHSPKLHGRHRLDGEFVDYYRKLSPRQRKEELLGQRSALLEEQNRLRQVLAEQEAMLKLKREQLHQQQMIQAKRLAHFEMTGAFPKENGNSGIEIAPPENDNHVNLLPEKETRTRRHDPVSEHITDVPQREARVTLCSPLVEQSWQTTVSPGQLPQTTTDVIRSSPNSVEVGDTSPSGRTSLNTSPIREKITSPIEEKITSPIREKTTNSPGRQYRDAATSYSLLSVNSRERNDENIRITASKQGNLPMMSNRQKSATSPKPLQSMLNTSREKKGLSILEIVDKLESSLDSSVQSQHSTGSNISLAMRAAKGGNSSANPSLVLSKDPSQCEDNDLAELEESQVLEDVFFLK